MIAVFLLVIMAIVLGIVGVVAKGLLYLLSSASSCSWPLSWPPCGYGVGLAGARPGSSLRSPLM
jgi:hypothetical protein